jgi:hypothetical protein
MYLYKKKKTMNNKSLDLRQINASILNLMDKKHQSTKTSKSSHGTSYLNGQAKQKPPIRQNQR